MLKVIKCLSFRPLISLATSFCWTRSTTCGSPSSSRTCHGSCRLSRAATTSLVAIVFRGRLCRKQIHEQYRNNHVPIPLEKVHGSRHGLGLGSSWSTIRRLWLG